MTIDSTSTTVSEPVAAPPDGPPQVVGPQVKLPTPRQVIEWLRVQANTHYRPARRMPAGGHVKIRDDVPANGTLHVCSEGNGIALAFQGSPDFIERWHNWAVNTAVIGPNAQLNWYLTKHTGSIAYVCPRTRAAVVRGLALQFAWEAVRDREVAFLSVLDPETEEPTVTWTEDGAVQIGQERAEVFYREHVRADGFVIERPKNLAPVYELAGYGDRAASSWGNGTEG